MDDIGHRCQTVSPPTQLTSPLQVTTSSHFDHVSEQNAQDPKLVQAFRCLHPPLCDSEKTTWSPGSQPREPQRYRHSMLVRDCQNGTPRTSRGVSPSGKENLYVSISFRSLISPVSPSTSLYHRAGSLQLDRLWSEETQRR